MSKLTKFFKHPVRFFKDSKLFGKPDVSSVQKCTNLFFITNYGQLEQIQALIKYEQLSDCFVCILHTIKNEKMPKLIVNSIDHELIAGYYLAKLPVSPNRIHIENLIFIRRLYSRIIRKAKPDNVFLLSFEVHYSLIASIANENRVPISLIEEGTGTYKFDEFGVNLAPVVDKENFKWEIFLISNLFFLSKIKPALETARNFDHIYAAFPDLLKSAFNYNGLTKFLLHAPGGKKIDDNSLMIIKKYDITSSDIIFVSQRYAVEPKLFFDTAFDFLNELAELSSSRVFIKLHPKESSSSLKAAHAKLINLGVDSKLFLITENNFLVEPIIAYSKPKAVIGIASTSLAYTSLVSPETNAISFGSYLADQMIENGSQKISAIEVIKSHVNILQKFPNVCMVSSPQVAHEVMLEHKRKNDVAGILDYRMLDKADQYYIEGKYWKAHSYYLWGFNGAEPKKEFFTQYSKFLINSLILEAEDLNLDKIFGYINCAGSVKLGYNERGLFFNVVSESIQRSYLQSNFIGVVTIGKLLKEKVEWYSYDHISLLYCSFASLLTRDFAFLNDLLDNLMISSLAESEVPSVCYLLVEAYCLDHDNMCFYQDLASLLSQESMFGKYWFDSVFTPLMAGSRNISLDFEKFESQCIEIYNSLCVTEFFVRRFDFELEKSALEYDSNANPYLEPFYFRELAFNKADFTELKDYNSIFCNKEKLHLLPASYQPVVLAAFKIAEVDIELANVTSLDFDLYHSSEMVEVVNYIVSSLFEKGTFSCIVSFFNSFSSFVLYFNISSKFKCSIALRKFGELDMAWELIKFIDISFDDNPLFIKHKAEVAVLLEEFEVAKYCWGKLAVIYPELVPSSFWFQAPVIK